ncbi:hypothetical protein [Saccharopolyspora sp. ASAGF58]|uniref:hypothetical protein n=1 Tax=Saccharopolyspora sp. ASAGF58 TaxID=2719023 RepID=UPI00144006B5|nr:hypothetical protein [Saccharopolyspora sp. ASAGF58]QIZ34980.1 hypothetical protein FDZ84_09895 [Saccharopolyspora sp. ASAGF58]
MIIRSWTASLGRRIADDLVLPDGLADRFGETWRVVLAGIARERTGARTPNRRVDLEARITKSPSV